MAKPTSSTWRPGRYSVTAKLTGFTDYRNENVPVNAGSIIPLGVTMSVGGLTERVDVTSETPVIETKKQTVSTNVNLDELQNIPTARDPWVVLQTVPGIVVDRVNVGGAESGQQSNYQAKGANPDQNTWNMDGIAITDMGALGSSPTYYDFDMFQEMQVTTGGADPANADARRAAEFRSAQRHEQVARHDALLLRERQPAVRQRLHRTCSARSPATTASASTRTGVSKAAGQSSRIVSSRGAPMARPSRC